jgi:hypothetical protein
MPRPPTCPDDRPWFFVAHSEGGADVLRKYPPGHRGLRKDGDSCHAPHATCAPSVIGAATRRGNGRHGSDVTIPAYTQSPELEDREPLSLSDFWDDFPFSDDFPDEDRLPVPEPPRSSSEPLLRELRPDSLRCS